MSPIAQLHHVQVGAHTDRSLLQRLNVVTTFTTTVLSVLFMVIALTNIQFDMPACKIDVKGLEMYVCGTLIQRLRESVFACRPPDTGFRGDIAGSEH